jgi:hypothetical protein
MKKRKNEKVVRDTILIVCGKTETEKTIFRGLKRKSD